jgi:hypothetical protein
MGKWRLPRSLPLPLPRVTPGGLCIPTEPPHSAGPSGKGGIRCPGGGAPGPGLKHGGAASAAPEHAAPLRIAPQLPLSAIPSLPFPGSPSVRLSPIPRTTASPPLAVLLVPSSPPLWQHASCLPHSLCLDFHFRRFPGWCRSSCGHNISSRLVESQLRRWSSSLSSSSTFEHDEDMPLSLSESCASKKAGLTSSIAPCRRSGASRKSTRGRQTSCEGNSVDVEEGRGDAADGVAVGGQV